MSKKSFWGIAGIAMAIALAIFFWPKSSLAPMDIWEWQNETYQKTYQPLLASNEWSPITTPRLKSFDPSGNLSEQETKECVNPTPENQKKYLRLWGGLCPTGWWLEGTDAAGKKFTIQSDSELLTHFGPIDNGEKAASFHGLTDFVWIDKNEVVRGKTLAVDRGFLIDVYGADVCNDGDIPRQLFLVENNGFTTFLAQVPRKAPLCNPS